MPTLLLGLLCFFSVASGQTKTRTPSPTPTKYTSLSVAANVDACPFEGRPSSFDYIFNDAFVANGAETSAYRWETMQLRVHGSSSPCAKDNQFVGPPPTAAVWRRETIFDYSTENFTMLFWYSTISVIIAALYALVRCFAPITCQRRVLSFYTWALPSRASHQIDVIDAIIQEAIDSDDVKSLILIQKLAAAKALSLPETLKSDLYPMLPLKYVFESLRTVPLLFIFLSPESLGYVCETPAVLISAPGFGVMTQTAARTATLLSCAN